MKKIYHVIPTTTTTRVSGVYYIAWVPVVPMYIVHDVDNNYDNNNNYRTFIIRMTTKRILL